ncbi:MAG: N-acetylmuramate alpha-1-phosphate uridylyltransferase MurU [Usitatibacter sp.]
MRALILAAGRGERLRPLTDTVPKPLLKAGGRSLIAWQVEHLARAGFTDLVVNHAHLGAMIERELGERGPHGSRIRYSPESPALETAGGIAKALHLLGDEPFVAVSSDIHTDFDYATLVPRIEAIARDPASCAIHLVLVDNPPYHPGGDMGLENGRVTLGAPKLTYGNIAVFHPALFRDIVPGTWLKLFPWVYGFVEAGRVSGEHYRGAWDNVGTAGQLAALDRRLAR